MGFFDKLKAAVGVGQPTLQIVTGDINAPKTQFKLSEPLVAEIVIEGKAGEVELNSLEVRLVETVTVLVKNNEGKLNEEKKDRIIAQQIFTLNKEKIKPGQVISKTATIHITNASVTGMPYSHKLVAVLDCTGLDPKKEMEVYLHY